MMRLHLFQLVAYNILILNLGFSVKLIKKVILWLGPMKFQMFKLLNLLSANSIPVLQGGAFS